MTQEEQELKDLEMVKQNGYSLQFVKNQTPEICLEAVKENPKAIIYVNIPEFKEKYPEYYIGF